MASDLRPIEQAPLEGRRLLGVLLAQRRQELGYTYWPAFAKARLPMTPSGNPNTRLLADIEKAYRDNFPEGRLRQLAQAYLVDYGSLVDVAHMKARALIPLPPAVSASLPVVSAHILPPAPMDDEARESSVRPYAVRLWDELLRLAARGVTDPPGVMLGLPPGDAKVWDGSAGAMSLADRAWLVADIQRRRDARTADSRRGTAGA